MKRTAIIFITIVVALLASSPITDAKTKRSIAKKAKMPSIEAIYKAHTNYKEMISIGLRRLYKHKTKINSCEVYGINATVTKTSKGSLKFTATAPHAFYCCEDVSDPPEGAFRDITFYGFTDKSDFDKFYNLLIKDGDENACVTYNNNEWYIIEVNENYF